MLGGLLRLVREAADSLEAGAMFSVRLMQGQVNAVQAKPTPVYMALPGGAEIDFARAAASK